MHVICLTEQARTSVLEPSKRAQPAQPTGQDVCVMLSGFLVFDAETGWAKSVLLLFSKI